ncbi:MAG: HAMP domain-containing histidine kinase [Actinomycetota bacterium]|nr:HAMP domain-containing histidine kinase [Actinomycetota bacterium]
MTTQTTQTVTTTQTLTTEGESAPLDQERPKQGRFTGIRIRLLASFVLLLALATAGSVVVVRTILLNRIADRIDSDLVQEAGELQNLAQGNDPETGRPFDGRVRRIFRIFFQRNIPIRYEAQLSFVDGEAFLRSRRVVPYRLDKDPDLVERWGDLTTSDRGTVDTPAGPVEYLAVPLEHEGVTRGVFVVAMFSDLASEEIEPAVAGAAGVGVVVLVIGSLLAWRTANRILAPVERVTATARGISESDLRRRIEVSGNDEIAHLGRTFNEMLDRLEQAFNTQRRFVDDAGHELRTPITIIQGQLETVGDDPEDRRRTMTIVMDELDRMSRFVNDLLLLARAERPDFLNLETVDVAELTQDLYTKSRSLGARDWVLDEVGHGKIVADAQRLTQAMMQLAENASRHTKEGEVIHIGSRVSDGWASLWVADTGPGIPLQEQDEIFDRFRRGRSRRRSSEGAGLGLSIVKAIAEAHRGAVAVSSAPGQGATFTVKVPVDQPEMLAEPAT